jgi:hypothetical protein
MASLAYFKLNSKWHVVRSYILETNKETGGTYTNVRVAAVVFASSLPDLVKTVYFLK